MEKQRHEREKKKEKQRQKKKEQLPHGWAIAAAQNTPKACL